MSDISGSNIKLKKKRGFNSNWKVILIFAAVFCVALFLGNRLTAKGILPMTTKGDLNKSFKEVKNIEQYKDLFSMREQLYKYYDGEIDEKKLVEGAIKGMTMALGDPYTYYMNKEEFDSFMEQNSGEYMGVGIQVGVKDKNIVVVSPVGEGPADKAGIKSGDIIRGINGVSVTGNDMDKAVKMMKGKTKEEITLNIERPNKGLMDVKVMRDVVKTINVKGEMVDDNIGYIQIKAFEENVGRDFKAKLEELETKGMKGLVLDLRGNPGGYMTESVDVVSNFIKKGEPIVSTIDKYDNKEKSLSVGGIAHNMPLVVLIDEGSASASEIVSGAIRDYKVGTLVGTTTFGKGIVQVPIKQKDGSALKVTISKYYTPSGENIHGTGIKPDVEVEYPTELKEKEYSRSADPQFEKAIEVINGKLD